MKLQSDSIIYLASPYSDDDPGVKEFRFDAACIAAATLMRMGLIIFSPIAHTHPIARHGLPGDWGFWNNFDLAFLRICHSMIVLQLPGWDQSVGVKAEVGLIDEMGKPIVYLDPRYGEPGLDAIKVLYEL